MRLVRCYDCNGHRGDWTLGGIQTGSDGGGRGEVGDRTPEERGPPRYGLAFLVAEAAAPSVGESEALARKQRLVLDKACRFLLD